MTSLNEYMEFDHIVRSDGEGNVSDAGDWCWYAPQPFVELDADGQMVSLDPADIYDLGGWKLLNGFSGQYLYSGPIMHESEYVGGRLETYIRENAGFYVCVEITGMYPSEDDGEPECVGWAVAYRELED
jgi:hypothetical protein